MLAPVAGVPFLEIILHKLARNEFCHVVLSVGYMADHVVQAIGSSFAGMDVSYVYEKHPLGTGGGVRLALDACRNDHAFVMNGDTFLDLDFHQVEEEWRKYGEIILIGRPVDNAVRYGRLYIKDGRVAGFLEKSSSGPGIINTGYYVLPLDALKDFPPGTAFSLENDFLHPLVTERPRRFFVTEATFIDIGIPDDYARAQVLFKNWSVGSS